MNNNYIYVIYMFIQLADASKYFLKYFITVNFVRIFGFTHTDLPGPNHQKTPQTLQKQYIYNNI